MSCYEGVNDVMNLSPNTYNPENIKTVNRHFWIYSLASILVV